MCEPREKQVAVAETRVATGVCQLRAPGSRWLVTGHDGGYRDADAAYNVSVPEGFDRTDLTNYAADRRERAGFEVVGPTLLTGVDIAHARGAHSGSVTVVATAAVSNPAALPVDPTTANEDENENQDEPNHGVPEVHDRTGGTVNVLVRTEVGAAARACVREAVAASLDARYAETDLPGSVTEADHSVATTRRATTFER